LVAEPNIIPGLDALQRVNNPIEKAFAKLKQFLRSAAPRTREALWLTIGNSIGRWQGRKSDSRPDHRGSAVPIALAFLRRWDNRSRAPQPLSGAELMTRAAPFSPPPNVVPVSAAAADDIEAAELQSRRKRR
jgi:hypothetical protein